MAEVKGVILNAWIQFLKSRYGEERVARGLQDLARAQEHQIAGAFLDSSWYPWESQGPLARLTRTLATPEDRNISFELGRFMADYAFEKVYKALLSREPDRLARNAWLEDSLFQGVRKGKSEMVGESSYLLRYTYEPGMKPTAGMCTSTIGFCFRQAELAGRTNVRVIHPEEKCAAFGNDCCEIVIEW
jgi:hypothetical protein